MADRKGSASLRSGNAVAGDGQPAPTPTPSQPSATAAVAASALFSTRSTSPYGTRSRNRGARVNYAEDKDNEMDYEYTESSAAGGAANAGSTTTTNTTPNHTTNTAATAGATSTTTNAAKLTAQGIDGAAGSSSRRQSGAISMNGQKETVVATLAPTNVAAGKKRKGGSQAVTTVQPMVKDSSLSNMLSFENPVLQDGKLIADDGTVLSVHDHIYLICEPPGEPYYLARIMEFLHSKNDPAKPVDSIRVNWYYRPKDIQRKVTDTRVLFASMHSDTCPLNSIRGKCYIRHRDEIENLDAYRKNRDSFYFERMFDRYIHRYYDVIPTTKVKNVPEAIRTVLCERWKFLLVEPQRAKELCSQMKECKRCTGYCAHNESVHCAVCGQSYHMNCVRPPLLKKPSRGFAWACGPCNQIQERKLEARHTPQLKAAGEAEEEAVDEDDEDGLPVAGARGGNGTETPSEAAVDLLKQQEPTPEQVNFAHMWQMRYLGQHCRVEDALDYDDRIYPRAASRIGPRHQAIVPPWAGRPVEYVKPVEVKRKHYKNAKNQVAKDAEAREKRPAWVMDEPPGYIERGGDDGTTSTLQFKIPVESTDRESAERGFGEKVEVLDEYMESTKKIAGDLKMNFYATNFVDKAAELLYKNDWEPEKALEQLSKVNPVKDLKEPRLKPEEIKRFEEGVAKYGSELHLVAKHVKTRKEADIVRYYYGWKKTPRGVDIWGNYDGRREKKANKLKNKESVTKLVDDVADDEDDSAFDVEKAGNKKRGFECKFCATRHSRQWRRAPGVAPGTLISTEKPNSHKKKQEEKWLVSALCRRCGELWRRYAIQWEDPEEVQKKMGQGGGRTWKRRIDEELLKELTAAQEDAKAEAAALAVATASVTPQPTTSVSGSATPDLQLKEPPKKKHKGETNGVAKKSKEKDTKDKEKAAADKAAAAEKQKEKEKSKEPPPPPPEPPKPRRAPCGVCGDTEEIGKNHAVCRDCKMTVHRRCYGVGEIRNANKWVCEMCANDKNPIVSTNYECVLCPHVADPDAEPEKNNPYHKSSYKKKAAEQKAKDSPEIDGRKVKDADKHRPQQPREPLKKTAHNNWAHVICSVFTPEIKFSDPPTMRVVEGVGAIPQARWLQECKICRVGGGSNGACVQCPTCHCFVHVGCANGAGWTLGFDIQPVKGSRRDTVNIVKVGNETGNMIAGVWCKEHNNKGVHHMNEVLDESGLTALELYVNTYKQADLTLTGTVRKANQVSLSTKTTPSHRRSSLVGGTVKEGADSPATVFLKTDGPEDMVAGIEGLIRDHVGGEGSKKCLQCDVSTSPLWWKASGPGSGPGSGPNGAVLSLANGTPSSMPTTTTNGITRTLGLLCHRCHCTEQPHPTNLPKQQPPPPQTNGVHANGEIPPPPQQQGKYTALPPLHQFLAEQHAILTKRQNAQAQAPALPPVAPTPPPPMMTGPIPVAQPGPPMGQQLSHQPPSMPLPQPPVQQGHPQMHHNGHAPPPHGPPPHGPPQHPQHAVLSHHPHAAPLPPPHVQHVQHPHVPHPQIQHPQVQHNVHNVPHPNGPHSNGPHPNHRPLSHPPPPLAHNMSPRVPQMSPRTPYNTSPRMSHMSPGMQGLPSPHAVPIHSPVRPNHPAHPSHHMAHQPPHGYHASPPPPYPMQRHLPQMAPTASMSVGQPGPSRQQEDDRRRMEEERRRRESEDRRREDERRNGRMSGASGSPALANLLS